MNFILMRTKRENKMKKMKKKVYELYQIWQLLFSKLLEQEEKIQ